MNKPCLLLLFLALRTNAQSPVWTIDTTYSTAHFAVKHMMVTTVRGMMGGVKGSVRFDPANINRAFVAATIDVVTLDSRSAARDEQLKGEDFFDIAKFPIMSFQSRSAEPLEKGKFALSGDLTMRGVTKSVRFEVEGPTAEVKDQKGRSRAGATATAKINRKDFGMTWNKTLDEGGVLIGDEVLITLDLELLKEK